MKKMVNCQKILIQEKGQALKLELRNNSLVRKLTCFYWQRDDVNENVAVEVNHKMQMSNQKKSSSILLKTKWVLVTTM